MANHSNFKFDCTVPGCGRKGPYRKYCTKHYLQMKKKGKIIPDSKQYTHCEVDGCNKPSRSRSQKYCEMHYYRVRRNGTTETVLVKVPDSECVADDCTDPAYYSTGECRNCYLRRQRNGSWVKHTSGENAWNWLGEEALNYRAVHQRVRAKRGSASQYECVDCGNIAKHWSYSHSSKNEKWGWHDGFYVPFGTSVDDYDPRCVPCHKRLDLEKCQERSSPVK